MYRPRESLKPQRRVTPYVLPRDLTLRGGRPLTIETLSQILPGIETNVTPEGDFVNWGWLNVPEIGTGLKNLGLLDRISVKVCTTNFCDLPHIPNGYAVIFLIKKHYICVAHVCHKLLYFDPLGQPAYLYFGNSLPQLAAINLTVQPSDSPLCGNFCLFFLHCLYNGMDTKHYSKNCILDGVRTYLQRYLYSLPQPIKFNTVMLEYFTIDYKIGEEFGGLHHRRFHRYESDLSSKAQSKRCRY
uniref:LO8 n=1 Tax=Barramundi adomavirus TaxID=2609870 RepID=A0A6F9FA63_9VIRU|nr:TPA_asm: LO8 [Barramundi adomavirus]